MIVYVETNFILELAFQQEQYQAASKILELSEEGKVDLVFPGFSISESLSKVTRQSRDRNEFHKSLIQTLQQLKRSVPYQQAIIAFDPVLALLQDAIKNEADQLISVIERMVTIGRLLEVDAPSFRQALMYKDQLSTEDSIVYATILADLNRRPLDEVKLFLSRDERAFSEDRGKKAKASGYNPRITMELAAYNCTYIAKFEDGLRFIEYKLGETR